jgi:hypothetical protein
MRGARSDAPRIYRSKLRAPAAQGRFAHCQRMAPFVRCARCREHTMRVATALLVLGLLGSPALAQSAKSDPPAVDFKPLIQPVLPPLVLPPNSYLAPGSISGDPVTPYSSTPGYDAQRSAPTPGLRLTIPTR